MTPTSIKLHQASGRLELHYPEGEFELSAEYLRVFSPSAEVKGHSREQAVLQHGKQGVKILRLEPQGHYAIKIVFTDGHDSGIFTWDYLFELGSQFDARWTSYLADLKAAGKQRQPQFIAVSK